MSDLPKGYRWAFEDEMDREDAIVVMRTFDVNGVPYTQDEADVAVLIDDPKDTPAWTSDHWM